MSKTKKVKKGVRGFLGVPYGNNVYDFCTGTSCVLVAFILHYTTLTSLSWLLVEALHIYRMLTDIRHVNSGPMKGYWLLGYLPPLIVSALSFALETDQFGRGGVCWVATNSPALWAFLCPLICAVVLIIVLLVLSLLAMRYRGNFSSREGYNLRVLPILVVITPLMWVFALLLVNTLSSIAYSYVYGVSALVHALCVLLGYIVLHRDLRRDIKDTVHKLQKTGSSLDQDSGSGSPARPSLSYRNSSRSPPGPAPPQRVNTSTTTSSSKSSGLKVLDAPPQRGRGLPPPHMRGRCIFYCLILSVL